MTAPTRSICSCRPSGPGSRGAGRADAGPGAGWPAIAAGRTPLLLAPTGSGKTLAAFLACLDHLWRSRRCRRGVRVLYISPLKALNNDIHRNLQVPLEGVAGTAQRHGTVAAAI